MLTFDAFDGRMLQNCISLLRICESTGDSIEVLISTMEATLIQRRPHKKEYPLVPKEISETPCPYCGIPMTCGMVVERLTINGCKKCRYSEVVK